MGQSSVDTTLAPTVELFGFTHESLIRQLGDFFNKLTHYLIKEVDVDLLECITFAINTEHYLNKISTLDNRYSQSNDAGVGTAKTVSKIKDDWGRNHIVVNCEFLGLEHLLDEYQDRTTEEDIARVVGMVSHLLFHEMCHVSHNKILLNRYPDLLTKEIFENEFKAAKHVITLACWDEFYVCSRANQFGADQEENYKTILLNTMNTFNNSRDSIFKEYKYESLVGNPKAYSNLFNKFMNLVYTLFKYCSYYLGDLISKENSELDNEVLNHELSDVVKTLTVILHDLYRHFENETLAEEDFHKIGEFAAVFARLNGLIVEEGDYDGLFINLDKQTQLRMMLV